MQSKSNNDNEGRMSTNFSSKLTSLHFQLPTPSDADIAKERYLLEAATLEPNPEKFLADFGDIPPQAFSNREDQVLWEVAITCAKLGKRPDDLNTLYLVLLEHQYCSGDDSKAKAIASALLNRHIESVGLGADRDTLMELKQEFLNKFALRRVQEEVLGVPPNISAKELNERLSKILTTGEGYSRDKLFKLELQALSKESNPLDKRIKMGYLAQQFSVQGGVRAIEQMLKDMSTLQRRGTAETRMESLEELFSQTSEAIEWLIPGIIPQGETVLLNGAPKEGKTLLAVDLAFAIATGEASFCGERPSKIGKVLLISVDESKQSTVNKLRIRGFEPKDSNLKYIGSWDMTQLNVLEQHLEDWRPTLVIIDSLKRITIDSDISENSPEFANNIYILKELLTKYGAAGVLIHHANKDSEASGVNVVRGSSAIAGAVANVMTLKRVTKRQNGKNIIDPSDNDRELEIFGRDCESRTINLRLNPDNLSFDLISKGEYEEEVKTMKDRIMDALKDITKPISGVDLKFSLRITEEKLSSFYKALKTLADSQIISCKPNPERRGSRYKIYSLPNLEVTGTGLVESQTPPPPVSLPSEIPLTTQTLTYQESQRVELRVECEWNRVESQSIPQPIPLAETPVPTALEHRVESTNPDRVGGGG